MKAIFFNDRFIFSLIALNTAIIFISGYHFTGVDRFVLLLADNVITGLFVVELLVKIKHQGFTGYLKSNWNRLDFVLVLVSLPSLVTFVFDVTILDVSFLLVFRVMRVFKAFRFIKFIPNINELIAGLRRALKASVFVLIGFVSYILIIGLLSFYIFRSSGTDYFSTPLISLYSIFKIFTVEGWFEIPEQLIENGTSAKAFFTYLYFIIVVLTGGILGLSLVNSIFVDAMVSDNNQELEIMIDQLNETVNKLLTKIESGHETRENP